MTWQEPSGSIHPYQLHPGWEAHLPEPTQAMLRWILPPASSLCSAPETPSHLRPLQDPPRLPNFPPGNYRRILQATPISSLLNTYCIDTKQDLHFSFIRFHLSHVTCFLTGKPLRSVSQTPECREAKRCPVPTYWLMVSGSFPVLEPARPQSARHTGSHSSRRPLSNEEGDKNPICPYVNNCCNYGALFSTDQQTETNLHNSRGYSWKCL